MTEDSEKLAELRRQVQVGIDPADRGEFSDRSVLEIAAAVLAEIEEVDESPLHNFRTK